MVLALGSDIQLITCLNLYTNFPWRLDMSLEAFRGKDILHPNPPLRVVCLLVNVSLKYFFAVVTFKIIAGKR